MCRALRHRADVRTSTASSATWLLESAFVRFPSPTCSQLDASSLRSTQLFLLDLVLGWAWYFNSGGTCVEVVDQKSATGAVQWVPNLEMMSHIIFFPAGLDNALTRPHHDTSTGMTSTFCLNPRLYSLIIQGHILNKPPHRHLVRTQHHRHGHNGYAVDSCLREKTRHWSVAWRRSFSIWIDLYACTLGYSDRCK